MRITALFVAAIVIFGSAVRASAQTPIPNPTQITFDHLDFAQTSSYEVGYFASATATVPVQSGTLPKPASCSPCTGPLPSRPTAFQSWWAGVRAVAGTTTSAWSALVPFVRVPLAPSNVLLQ